MSVEQLALMIPIMALMIPIVAILVKPFSDAMRRRERVEARKAYQRLVEEKLDVIKTAIAMGYGDAELRELDARLEKLVGTEKLKELLEVRPGVPVPDAELSDTDLAGELARARGERNAARERR
jgi:hypothetical protein